MFARGRGRGRGRGRLGLNWGIMYSYFFLLSSRRMLPTQLQPFPLQLQNISQY